MTNPVATLAALLQQVSEAFKDEALALEAAAWLLARGVQYAPPHMHSGPRSQDCPACQEFQAGAAPPREPPPPSRPTHPTQPLIEDGKGVLRFKPNAIVRFMLDTGRNLGAFDMNKFAMMEFGDEDRRQLAQLIGYSLGGYEELSYCEDDILERVARGRPEGPSAPPGPWFVCGPYGDIDHLNWRVEAPQRLSNGGYSKDEAFAVCHALNRIGSRTPEGT